MGIGLEGVGGDVKKCSGVWGAMRSGVEKCWKRCEKCVGVWGK